jgi:hypothetical protein
MSERRRRNAPKRQQARQPARQGGRRRPATGADFWGTESTIDDVPESILPSDDPAAMVTSLGPPPLPGHETAAQHYFDAVYAMAGALAIALAAASGLLVTDEDDEPPTDEPL